MSVLAFPDPRKAREEASLWLARLDRGLSDDERTGLRDWLRDAMNNRAFLEMGKLWRGLEIVSVLSELFPLNPEVLNPRPRRSFPSIALAAIAAACISAVGTLMLAGDTPWSFFDSRPPPRPMFSELLRTGLGEKRVTKLADGSMATLNTNTRMVVFYAPLARDVYLSYGEASFDVARDPARPFNVHAGKRVIQASGTSFNVRLFPDDNVELTVTDGQAKVLYTPQRPLDTPERLRDDFMHVDTLVNAQEMALVEPTIQSVRKVEPNEVDSRLAWQRGEVVFQGEPLEQVLAEVSRYTTTRFVIGDEKLRDVRVGGYFKVGDIENFLVALRENFLIEWQRDQDGRVVLTAVPSAP
ncbi:MAG: FecR domain-containing protein [Gammaproteobacteria bacterium]